MLLIKKDGHVYFPLYKISLGCVLSEHTSYTSLEKRRNQALWEELLIVYSGNSIFGHVLIKKFFMTKDKLCHSQKVIFFFMVSSYNSLQNRKHNYSFEVKRKDYWNENYTETCCLILACNCIHQAYHMTSIL